MWTKHLSLQLQMNRIDFTRLESVEMILKTHGRASISLIHLPSAVGESLCTVPNTNTHKTQASQHALKNAHATTSLGSFS